MNERSFDPNAIQIGDIFHAKREWRKGMGSLPFEQKIEIVKQLQEVPRIAERNEKLIFSAFLEIFPELSELLAEWDVVEDWYEKRGENSPPEPFDKRPDIIAKTKSGTFLGIELKSWLNYEQITAARKKEKIQDRVLRTFRDQPPNDTRHIHSIVLYPREVRFDAQDSAAFHEQVLRLIHEKDDKWLHLPSTPRSRRENVMEFKDLPLLGKYLNRVEIRFNPDRQNKHKWIFGPSQSSHFSPATMRQTLEEALLKYRDDERYKDLVGLDEVYLLVHYDFRAFAYNTPFAAPGYGFTEAAKFASDVLAENAGYFDRIFLFQFLPGQEKAYEVAPEFKAVGRS